ncbi:MAG: DUF3298 and DUF4163 domain-containing protein [Lachnospiraceae bacterium]|nr:DUF3298 and DUF4163 domain-containing protein [Lachnospiraceae bacterium]
MNIMKKRLLYAAMALVTILCSACSNQTAPAEKSEITVNDNITNTEDAHDPTVITPETGEATEQDDTVQNTQNNQNTEITDNTIASQNDENYNSVSAQITFITEEDSESAEDGKLLYTSRCVYPVVTMEGNESATDKINADIQARVDAFLADTSIREYAKEDYQWYLSNEAIKSEYGFAGGYYYDFEMISTRNDSNVISFLITISSYSGGAHGGYRSTGLNYNAKTGETIVFSELSENEESFHADTLAYLKELAATNTYRSIMYDDNSMWKEEHDMEQVLFQDERWYLSTYGLVFFSHPYELGAFFAGEIEFTVPYSDLKEMGFQEKYSYHENLTIKLQTEEVCLFDLNGDGVEEEIQFYIDRPGMGDTDVHFILNGIDYVSQHEELASQFSANEYLFCWAQCFLYDMNAEDDTIEIAFQMNNWREDSNTPDTFLYRYQKNGLFTFLGMMEGTVTDPAFSANFGK